jgi:hypothetical protein
LQAGILLLILLAVMFGLFKGLKFNKKKSGSKQNAQKIGGLRRLLGGALSLISPELSKWMFGETSQEISTEFYKRLARILQKTGQVRLPSQTHREFANEAISGFVQHEQNGLIQQTITDATELFYQVRFGRVPLSEEQRQQVMEKLNQLEQCLGSAKASPIPR